MVVSADRTAPGLWEMFQSIFTLTFNLLQYDVLVRGGLTGGGDIMQAISSMARQSTERTD